MRWRHKNSRLISQTWPWKHLNLRAAMTRPSVRTLLNVKNNFISSQRPQNMVPERSVCRMMGKVVWYQYSTAASYWERGSRLSARLKQRLLQSYPRSRNFGTICFWRLSHFIVIKVLLKMLLERRTCTENW